MAVFKLSESTIFDFELPESLDWESERKLGTPLVNCYPGSRGVLPNSLRAELGRFLFGEAIVDGPGKIKGIYPFTIKSTSYIKFPNLDFSFIPYLLLEAIPEPGHQFLGWFNERESKIVSETKFLVCTERFSPYTVSFHAKFT